MRGWRGNDLGLSRWQVELVHNASEAVRWRICEMVQRGTPFHEAKERAIRQASASWRGFGPEVAEGINRVVSSYRLSDLDKPALRRVRERSLVQIEVMRGRKAGRIERALFRLTGLSF